MRVFSEGYSKAWFLLFWLILVISIGSVISGLSGFNMGDLPWIQGGLKRFISFSLSILPILLLVAFLAPNRLNHIAMSGAAIFIIGSVGVAPFVSLLWIALSSLIAGRLLLAKVFRELESELSPPPLDLLLGLGFYATLISILAHYKVNYPIVYEVLLIAPLVIRRREIGPVIKKFILATGNSHSIGSPYLVAFVWYLLAIYSGNRNFSRGGS